MVVQLRRMAFPNKIYSPRGGDFCPPISRSSVTPIFYFISWVYIELQVYKHLPKSECRFYLGGMTLNSFVRGGGGGGDLSRGYERRDLYLRGLYLRGLYLRGLFPGGVSGMK